MTTVQAACFAGVAAFAALTSIPATAADHPAHLRAVEDQVFGMVIEARSLRWAVVDTPMSEADRSHLLKHADEVYEELIDLQKNVFRGRSDDHLCGEADDVHDAVCDLRDELRERSRESRYGFVSGELAARVEGLHSATEALHAFIDGSGGPVVLPPSPIGADYPHRTIYEVAPAPVSIRYSQSRPSPASQPGRTFAPSSHYGSPYPRARDLVLPPVRSYRSDEMHGHGTEAVRPQPTPLPVLPRLSK